MLVLSHYVEKRYAADLIASDTKGFGFLLKDRVADMPAFPDAVDVVGSGGTVLDPEVGKTNSAIAATLHVSVGSAEKRIASTFTKLGLAPDESQNHRVLAVLCHLEF